VLSGGLLITSQQVVLILQLIKLVLLGLNKLNKLLVFHISAAKNIVKEYRFLCRWNEGRIPTSSDREIRRGKDCFLLLYLPYPYHTIPFLQDARVA
jgi:hypothetical protein